MKLTNQSRVFIDSSVLFAAALSSRGYASDLLLAGIAGQCHIFLSPSVMEETRRNLILKHPASLPLITTFETLLTNVVDPDPQQMQVVASLAPLKDPDDVHILAGAILAGAILAGAITVKAEYLATYDKKHLLSIKDEILNAFGITVLTPQELCEP